MKDRFKKVNASILNHSILVGVSGGIDSMVLLDLLLDSKVKIEIAHIDHLTRSGQSTEDAEFVRSFSIRHNLPFHLTSFSFVKGNFQKAARTFRRKYFEDICKKRNLNFIATAHHKDDVIENYVLASFRGSHLHRLVTPLYKQGKYIRPLLPFTKMEIEKFAIANSIAFREDITNNQGEYTRNYIRNQILPSIYSKIPQGKKGIEHTIHKLKLQDTLFSTLVDLLKNKFLEENENTIEIDLDYLLVNSLESILPFIIPKYGFSEDQLSKMPTAKTGALFKSKSHEAVIHRSKLIISPIVQKKEVKFSMPGVGTYNFQKYKISIFKKEIQDVPSPHAGLQTFNLDIDDFPLEIRRIKPGDRIYPARLKGKSIKISKALTDLKIDRLKKNNTLIISTFNRVLWAYPYLVEDKIKRTNRGIDYYIEIKENS